MNDTFTPPITSNEPETKEISPSNKSKFERFYFNPMKKFSSHESLIIMMVCLPLLERYLRRMTSPPDNLVVFSHNSPAIQSLALHLGISSSEAYVFWNIFRNGLLHRGSLD